MATNGSPAGTGRQLLARQEELRQIAWLLDAVEGGPVGLVLEGEPGIGKTSLWNRAVSEALDRGYRVLASKPTEPEAKLSFASIGDLFGPIEDEHLETLPDPQRRAVEIALLRSEPHGPPPDWRAIGVAIVGILRSASGSAPVLVAIDDVQWIDRSSARVVEFALRRLSDERVAVLIAVRGAGGTAEPPLGLGRALPEGRVRDVPVGPLAEDDLDRLIRSRLSLTLPPPALRQLHDLSGGNPFFALEIARAQVRGEPRPTGQSLPIPRNLREDLLGHRLAALPAASRDLLLIASAVSRPTARLLRDAAGRPEIEEDITRCVEAGILEPGGDRIAFVHPLFGAAVYGNASRARRHEVHARLAELADDPEERARHLALATEPPDEAVAATLEEAAGRAFDRAAPDAAAELLGLSLRLTPPELGAEVRRRHLGAGKSDLAAGDVERGIEHLEQALAISSEGTDRAEVLRLLAGTAATTGDLARSARLLRAAIGQTDIPPALRAAMLGELSLDEWDLGDVPAAAKDARDAVRGAAGGSPGDQLAVLRAVRSRALAQAAKDDPEGAIASLGRALRGIDAMPPTVELGRTLLMLGSLRRRNRQKASARDALQRALEVFEAIGASAWSDRARAEMARIGGRPPAAGELTPTEHRVATLAAAGRTNREIADTLFTSVRTVEGHLSHIYAKLGIRSRTELAVFFEPADGAMQP